MYLKQLKISSIDGVLRDIQFHNGVNLIVDETDARDRHKTGNNVGKTTVLKVIDYCLGAKAKAIYSDPENQKIEYTKVKEYLESKEVLVTLVLTDSINYQGSEEIIIERNFLTGKQAIRRVNGKRILEKDFEEELARLIIPELEDCEKPTFRQVISHNIRYKDESVIKTLKTLNQYSTNIEYEALYLFMLGCSNNYGARKQALIEGIKKERAYYDRLRNHKSETDYKLSLDVIDSEIRLLNQKKTAFNLNPDFDKDLTRLNEVKRKINENSSHLNNMDIRIALIEESINALEKDVARIDLNQLRSLYEEAQAYVSSMHKKFEELVAYHNQMLEEKTKYLSAELPSLKQRHQEIKKELDKFLNEESILTKRLTKGDSFSELEELIADLNEQYRRKGEVEAILNQLTEVEKSLETLEKEIDLIDADLLSGEFHERLLGQVKKLNGEFSAISRKLYEEQYYLTVNKKIDKKTGREYYAFESNNANVSSGKKQGEILCFDLAYTLFADSEQISCLHFLLNDKKELMHGHQLVKVAQFAEENNIQLIFSILKDKLPKELDRDAAVVLSLSQSDKVFRIEEFTKQTTNQ